MTIKPSTVILRKRDIIDAKLVSMLSSDTISITAAARRAKLTGQRFSRCLGRMVKVGLAPTSLLRFKSVQREFDACDSIVVEDGTSVDSAKVGARIAAAEALARQAREDLNSALAMSSLLAGISEAQIDPPEWIDMPHSDSDGESVPIIVLTDWHLGERVHPEQSGGYAYDTFIAEDRVMTAVNSAIALTRRHLSGLSYPGVICALGGDLVSGGIHPELAESDEMGILQSILAASNLATAAISRLADEFGKVFVPVAVGNHGRFLDRKPRAKGYAHRNADWMIYELITNHFRNDERIHVMNPAAGETAFSVYGIRFLLTHGDRLGAKGGDGIIGAIGPIMRGSTKTFRSIASVGQQVDHMIIGHWHQSIFLPNVTVCGSSKGPDEYAMRILRAPAEDPSQTLIVVNRKRGITFRQALFLRDSACPGWADDSEGKDKPWVAIFNPRAA